MKIDIIVAMVLLTFALTGLYSGAIKQLGHLAGVIAGYLGAKPLAGLVAPLMARQLGFPPLVATVACSFLCFFLLYLAAAVLTRMLLAKVFPSGEHGALNRLGGLLLGFAKTALILFVILSGLVFLEKPVGNLWHDFRLETAKSKSMGLARRYNLFSTLPQLSGLSRVAQAARDPEYAAQLAEDPEYKALSRDPRMKALVNDQAINRAFATGDVQAMLSSVQVMNVLNDPKMMERLGKLATSPSKAAPAAAPSGN